MMLYVSMKFHENILKGFQVIEWTRNDQCQISKGNNYKLYRQALRILCSASCLMMLYICMKFHENILKGFQVKSGHEMTFVKFQKGIITKLYRQELWFLCSACRLMMLYISMKFHDNILERF